MLWRKYSASLIQEVGLTAFLTAETQKKYFLKEAFLNSFQKQTFY